MRTAAQTKTLEQMIAIVNKYEPASLEVAAAALERMYRDPWIILVGNGLMPGGK